MNNLLAKVKYYQKQYQEHKLGSQDIVMYLHNMKDSYLAYHMNIDNYLYRNGIFNRKTAVDDIKRNLAKFAKFPSHQKIFKKELSKVKHSRNTWFENYGVHDGYHDLIKPHLDSYKMNGLLTSLICDIYVGTYNEGSTKDLMSFVPLNKMSSFLKQYRLA